MDKDFDIRIRTLNFSKDLLVFTQTIKVTEENKILKRQIIRSGTSIGANVYESNGGHSKKDFANYINIALKSTNETIYWFQLIRALNPELEANISKLEGEAVQLAKILAKIAINSRKV